MYAVFTVYEFFLRFLHVYCCLLLFIIICYYILLFIVMCYGVFVYVFIQVYLIICVRIGGNSVC